MMSEDQLYLTYKGIFLPKEFHSAESLRYLEEFIFRPDDVLIATFPKSGTTWTQEIVPLVLSGADPASVETLNNLQRCPWVEETEASRVGLELRASPRVITTHMHHHMMSPSFFSAKPKVIYVMRNPKDVFTSLYHYSKACGHLVDPGPKKDFLHKFLSGDIVCGSWFDHVRSWVNAEDKSNIFYLSYEEMIQDLESCVSRVSSFLSKPLDAQQIQQISERCQFNSMRKNIMSNYSYMSSMDQSKSQFFRKGICGDWRNLLTEEESLIFDSVYQNKIQDIHYRFVWD